RMHQRRHRCRAGHCVRQPHVERNLRALAGAAEEQEQANRRDDGSTKLQRRCTRADAHEVERTEIGEHQEHGDEKAEIADAIDDEGLLACVSVRFVAEPEADEQIRAQSNAFPPDEQQWIVAAQHEQQHEEDEEIQIGKVARIAGIVLHVPDAEQMDEETDARHDEGHHHRELIELEGRVDLHVTDGHPGEVALHERRGHVAAARVVHGQPDRGAEQEREEQHAWSHEACERRVLVAFHLMMVVAMRAAAGIGMYRFVRLIVRGMVCMIVAMRERRISGPAMVRGDDRKRAVDEETQKRQQWHEPDPRGDRDVEWMVGGWRARRGRRGLQQCVKRKHQPLSRLMFCRLTVCRWRNSAMMIASPTAASAAATVMTKNTNTWPATPYAWANAMKVKFTALSISSTHMNTMIALRRTSTPNTPITNRTAEKKSASASIRAYPPRAACRA